MAAGTGGDTLRPISSVFHRPSGGEWLHRPRRLPLALPEGWSVMLAVGFAAPHFDCTAVVGGHLVRLRWEQVHDNRPLVLLFGSLGTAGSSDPLVALVAATGLPHANVAVVCRNDLYDVLAWANGPPSESGPGALAFPLIADPDGRIASLYGLAAAGRGPTWGHFVIDPSDIIREAGVSDFPYWPGVEELLRSVRASGFPADKGLWN